MVNIDDRWSWVVGSGGRWWLVAAGDDWCQLTVVGSGDRWR